MRGSLTLAVLACLVAVGVGAPARAATVTIEYEITGGTASGEFFAGSVTGGKFKVTFQASGANTVLTGPATIETFTVRAFLLSTLNQYLEQTVQLTLLAPLMGQGAPGSAFLGGGGNLSGYSILHCVAPGNTIYGYYNICTYLGFALSSPKLYSSFRFYPDAGNGVSIQGASGAASGSYATISGYSGRASVQFTGREVSRSFVPEPVRHALAPVVLLALVVLSSRRRAGRARS